jgi:hypothetical protein
LKKRSLKSLIVHTNSAGIVKKVNAITPQITPTAIAIGQKIRKRIKAAKGLSFCSIILEHNSLKGTKIPYNIGPRRRMKGKKIIFSMHLRYIFELVDQLCNPPGHEVTFPE